MITARPLSDWILLFVGLSASAWGIIATIVRYKKGKPPASEAQMIEPAPGVGSLPPNIDP